MKIFLYDGTFRGFLTVMHVLSSGNHEDILIQKRSAEQPGLFCEETQVVKTETARYKQMVRKIETSLSREVLNIIKNAFLSESGNIENALVIFIARGLKMGTGVINALEDKHIHQVMQASRRTCCEVNKYLGIIRFTDCGNGLKYACIEPDANVLPLVAAHFKARFPEEQWVIHDTKRALILLYAAGNLELIDANALDVIPGEFNPQDPFPQLWKKYFLTMGIESRKNSKLQRQFLPEKRRKYVIELID